MGRINEIWQTDFDGKHVPYLVNRWPEQFIEIHPDDATPRGIESGDRVQVQNDDVLIQTGGFIGVEEADTTLAGLQKAGLIKIGSGSFEAVAIVSRSIRPGVTFTNALNTKSPGNSVVHRVPDPITNRYRFKLGKGRITKIGESPQKADLTQMTFKPRDII